MPFSASVSSSGSAELPPLSSLQLESPAKGDGWWWWGVAATVFQAVVSPFASLVVQGELYFMSTGVPSATAARGVIYKVTDPSR